MTGTQASQTWKWDNVRNQTSKRAFMRYLGGLKLLSKGICWVTACALRISMICFFMADSVKILAEVLSFSLRNAIVIKISTARLTKKSTNLFQKTTWCCYIISKLTIWTTMALRVTKCQILSRIKQILSWKILKAIISPSTTSIYRSSILSQTKLS